MNRDPILRVGTKILVGPILLFGLYVQFHGDFGHSLIFGLKEGRRIVSQSLNMWIMILGVLLYGGVGIVSIFLDGTFLDYNVLAHDSKHGQHIGIILIELGVGMTVAGVMLMLFHLFSSWKEDIKK